MRRLRALLGIALAAVVAWPAPAPAVPPAASTQATPATSELCTRVATEQRALLDAARRTATLVDATPHDIRYGPSGGLYELPSHDAFWPTDRDQALALFGRVHATAIARARREHDRAALWILERSAPSEHALVPLSRSLYPAGACSAYAGGAWSLEARDLATTRVDDTFAGKTPVWSGKMALVHRDAAGERVARDVDACCGKRFDGDQANDPPTLFDFDGDGEPEVLFHTRLLSDGPVDRGRLLVETFRDHAIVAYPRLPTLPAGAVLLGAPVDVDGDGRPDLHTDAGLHVGAVRPPPVCWGPLAPSYFPSFVVHSLPDGSFSMTDEVAKRDARGWCPARPRSIESATDAGCARLWASTPELVASERARVDASCTELDAVSCRARPRDPKKIIGCTLRREAFDRTPPFTLP